MTLHPLTLGSSHSIAVGDELAIVGDPLGFNRSLSTGVVSGLDRTIQAPSGFLIAHSIQTDAAINPGSARGPLLDPNGRVIGIADQIATGTNQFGRSSSETSTGVGFAVPIDLAKIELPQLKRGPASHPTPTSAGHCRHRCRRPARRRRRRPLRDPRRRVRPSRWRPRSTRSYKQDDSQLERPDRRARHSPCR